jgi:hypothetical protein
MGTKKVQLNLYLPEAHRDMLQRMAGERMLENPKRSSSASKIGAEILCDYLEELNEIERSNKK